MTGIRELEKLLNQNQITSPAKDYKAVGFPISGQPYLIMLAEDLLDIRENIDEAMAEYSKEELSRLLLVVVYLWIDRGWTPYKYINGSRFVAALYPENGKKIPTVYFFDVGTNGYYSLLGKRNN